MAISQTASPSLGLSALAVVSGAFLSGAMMSLSAFVIPVFLGTNAHDGRHTVQQWALLYGYGRTYMPGLCIVTCGLHGLSLYTRGSRPGPQHPQHQGAAMVSTMAMVPFTWLFMAPTNNMLFGLEAAARAGLPVSAARVRELAVTWALLHVVRSLFPLLGSFWGFSGLLRGLAA